MATCIATNVIFLQATHFVDIDSRDHFFQHSFGGKKTAFWCYGVSPGKPRLPGKLFLW